MEVFVASFIAFDELFTAAVLDGFCKDGIGVKIIEDEDVVHAAAGDKGKFARQVGADEAFQFIEVEDGGANFMGAITNLSRGLKVVLGGYRRRSGAC